MRATAGVGQRGGIGLPTDSAGGTLGALVQASPLPIVGLDRDGAAFIQKPFSPSLLVARVRDVLDQPERVAKGGDG